MAYTKYSLTPADNNAAPPNGAPEGMLPSAVNDTMRDMMAQIRDVGDGIRGGTYTMTAPVITGGSITGVALSGNTFTNPVITGGSINNTPIGATTANTGAFTTLGASGVATFSAGTVSAPAITTTGDTNTGIFFPAADTIAFTEGGVESMRIDSSGNVGIGTSNASGARLTVRGAGTTSATASFEAATSGGNTRLYVQDDGTTRFFGSSNSETMRIDSSGNVGIGTSNPSFGLDIQRPNSSTLNLYNTTASSNDSQPVQISSFNGTYWNYILSNASSFRWATFNTERMRIDSSGNLCLGQTTADGKMTSNAASDSQRSYHAGNLSSSVTTDGMYYAYCNTVSGTGYNFAQYQNASAVVFKVIGNGNVQNTNNSYGAISDAKLKNIIGAAPSYWDKFKQYQFVNYTLKADESEIKLLGLVAQQVEAISPSLIEETADRDAEGNDLGTTTKGIKYSVVTLQAEVVLQEAMARIEALEAKVDAQAARIAALESN